METERHSWAVRAWFPILKAVVWLVFCFFAAPLRPVGRRNVPVQGGLLVISNHISNTDPVIVQYACPRLLHFLARRDLFSMGLVGRFVTWWKGIPIKQSSADKGAIKKAIGLLRAGEAVAIFPEGQLSTDGQLIELFAGTALIIRKADTPCICLGISGANRMMPYPRVVPTWAFKQVRVNWGVPHKFGPDTPDDEIMGWIEAELKRLSGQA